MTPEEALRDNKRYAAVWEVLQALRAHDERFDALVNRISLTTVARQQGQRHRRRRARASGATRMSLDLVYHRPRRLARRDLRQDRREGRLAPLLDRLGQVRRRHRDPADHPHPRPPQRPEHQRARRVRHLPRRPARQPQRRHHRVRRHRDARPAPHHPAGLRRPLQGIAVPRSTTQSPRPMERMLAALDQHDLEDENRTLEKFYDSVRMRVEGIDSAEGRQKIITGSTTPSSPPPSRRPSTSSASSTPRSRSSTSSSAPPTT